MYSKELIQTTRPRAMYDKEIHAFHNSLHISSMDDNYEELID